MELKELKKVPVRSLYHNIELASQKYGDHPLFAFERNRNDYEISYNEFYEYTNAVTRALIHFGLAGKRVAIIGENSPEWIVTYLSTITAGGVAVPIDVALSKEQLVEFAKMAEVEVLAYSSTWASFVEEHADEFEGVLTTIHLILKLNRCMSLKDSQLFQRLRIQVMLLLILKSPSRTQKR